jgi:cytochrome c peroxidase
MLMAGHAAAQLPPGLIDVEGQFGSLKLISPAPTTDLAGVVMDGDWARVLGKALFWDQKAGSDGQACASCHFHAGADPRFINQSSPGLRAVPLDGTFQRTAVGLPNGPNHVMTALDFPYHQLADPTNRNSAVRFDTNDVTSSAGTFAGNFTALAPGGVEKCTFNTQDSVSKVFAMAGQGKNKGKTLYTRRDEPRNTPSVINAIYNIRNFWDGRANNIFNGVNPFGLRDPTAGLVVTQPDGSVAYSFFYIPFASLASQAVGPALSDMEMSCDSKSFADLGRKLGTLPALSTQAIDPNDSAFGTPGPFGDVRGTGGVGLKQTYVDLVTKAFAPNYWADQRRWSLVNGSLVEDPNGYTQFEMNFSMFWGIAIMMYEATLVSDDSPFDRYMDAGMPAAGVPGFGAAEIRGMGTFGNEGQCIHCHDGPAFTRAGIGLNFIAEDNVVERMTQEDGKMPALYDNGFYNIGARPTRDDVGLGGFDPFGFPLSFARQWVANPNFPTPDPFSIDPCQFFTTFETGNCLQFPDNFSPMTQRVAVDGTFKTPSLRNVALTPPYFHNGGQGSLEQVVDFYFRGGDTRNVGGGGDTSGTGPLGEDPLTTPPAGSNVHPLIFPRKLTTQQRSDLVAFLKSLTDDRVRCHAAPFDHPELTVSHGVNAAAPPTADGKAAENSMTIVSTGSGGLPAKRCAAMPNAGNVAQLPLTMIALDKSDLADRIFRGTFKRLPIFDRTGRRSNVLHVQKKVLHHDFARRDGVTIPTIGISGK